MREARAGLLPLPRASAALATAPRTASLTSPTPSLRPPPPSGHSSPQEPNDIPLARLSYQFNERLVATLNTQVPRYGCRCPTAAAVSAAPAAPGHGADKLPV